jgi:hypothetical protein
MALCLNKFAPSTSRDVDLTSKLEACLDALRTQRQPLVLMPSCAFPLLSHGCMCIDALRMSLPLAPKRPMFGCNIQSLMRSPVVGHELQPGTCTWAVQQVKQWAYLRGTTQCATATVLLQRTQ